MSFLYYRDININAKSRALYVKAQDLKNKHAQSNHNKCLRRKALNLDYHHHNSYIIREYLILSNICDIVVQSSLFNNWILLCIIVAGVLVGMQTYGEMAGNFGVEITNIVVLYSFTAEVVLKIISEGTGPQWYFFGEDWKWNWFDLLIVLFSFDGLMPVGGSGVKLLRLFRLARLAKVFRKVAELRMIMVGLIGGLKSVFYILILMMLLFYIFGVAGVIFFRDNDPFNFNSIEIALLVLLQVATLDNWGEIFYVNYFGCRVFSGSHYVNDRSLQNSEFGGLKYCGTPVAQEAVTAIYFILFIFLCSFCLLSLFIGTITLSMAESIVDLKISKEKARQKREKEKVDIMEVQYIDKKDKQDRSTRRLLKMLEVAFQGEDIYDYREEIILSLRKPLNFYKWVSVKAVHITENEYFQKFYTFIIILAGVLVGFGTDPISLQYESILIIIDNLIQYLFLLEVFLKMLTYEFKIWRYFQDGWNLFDFVVVMGAFAPAAGSLVLVLRLLRLLRVLKLMRAVKQLQVILYALSKGANSILFISIILFLFYYFFAIAGMAFFDENDPDHFGTLHMALITLFQMSTFDGWAEIMWISTYGCAQANYGPHCDPKKSSSQFIFTSIYWVLFVVIGGLVLLSLFIGVVSMGMDDARHEAVENAAIDKRALKIAEVEGLSPEVVFLYKEVFSLVDISNSERIGREEMKLGLKIGGLHLENKEFEKLWIRVDQDGSNNISFCEFLEFMITLKAEIAEEEAKLVQVNHKRRFTFLAGMKSTKEYMESLSTKQKILGDIAEKNDAELTLDKLLGLDSNTKGTVSKQKILPVNESETNLKLEDLQGKNDEDILDALLGLGDPSDYDTSLVEEIKTPRASKNGKISPRLVVPLSSNPETSPNDKEVKKIDEFSRTISPENNPFAITPDSTEALQQKMLISPYLASPTNFMIDPSFASPYSQQPGYVIGQQPIFTTNPGIINSAQQPGGFNPLGFPTNHQFSPRGASGAAFSNQQVPLNFNPQQQLPFQSNQSFQKGFGFQQRSPSPGKKSVSTKIVGV